MMRRGTPKKGRSLCLMRKNLYVSYDVEATGLKKGIKKKGDNGREKTFPGFVREQWNATQPNREGRQKLTGLRNLTKKRPPSKTRVTRI